MYISVATCVLLPLIGGTKYSEEANHNRTGPLCQRHSASLHQVVELLVEGKKKQLAMATGHPSSEGGKDRKKVENEGRSRGRGTSIPQGRLGGWRPLLRVCCGCLAARSCSCPRRCGVLLLSQHRKGVSK